MRDLFYFVIQLIRKPVDLLKKVKIGKKNRIERGVFLSKSIIGNYNYIGHFCIMDLTHIGSYCSIGANTQIGGADHDITNLSTSFRLNKPHEKPITKIEDDVWIGAKATIAAGVTIGRGAVIGAGAFVRENVDPYAVVVGTPARKIKTRLTQEIINKLELSTYWEKQPEQAKKILAGIMTDKN